jgi:YidC/Oxa1 family membrane protein insertase
MGLWTNFVDLIHAILVGLAMVFGGNMALAIGVLSLGFRLALLPLTLRMAYRSLQIQAALRKVEPELSRIRKRYKDDPQRMWEETTRVHRREGINILSGGSLLGILIQAPLFIGLFSAIRRGLTGAGRFLWIKDLLKADPLLAAVCALLTGLAAMLGANAPEQQRTATIVIPAALTLIVLWRMSAGVTIYTFSSSGRLAAKRDGAPPDEDNGGVKNRREAPPNRAAKRR